MQTISRLLSIIAIPIALGGAVVSAMLIPKNVYAKIKRQGSSVFVCEQVCNLETACGATGAAVCLVTVVIDLPASSKQVTAYADSPCSTPLRAANAINICTYNPGGTFIIDASN